ncbi:uncharacterized protein LOC144477898, partial [Augochlora pura]
MVEKRVKANKGLFDKFDSVQSSIEVLVVGTELEAIHLSERDTFETAFFSTMANVERYIAKCRGPSPVGRSSDSQSPAITEGQSVPRLPTIVLPSFDGDYSTWLRFRDTFETLIHNNESLSDIQRFHYLNSALKGPAARIVQSLGISEINYKLAWISLKKRYEDPTALLYHHANAIIEMPSVQRQSCTSLREFIDSANNHLLALEALGEEIHSWDLMIVLLLSKKLDSVTCKEWDKVLVSLSGKPRFKDFIDFLEQQAKLLERTSINMKQIPIQPSRPFANRPVDYKTKFRSETLAANMSYKPVLCLLCKDNHQLAQCAKLKAMSFSERKCGKKHHTLLHKEEVHTPRDSEPSKSPDPVAQS